MKGLKYLLSRFLGYSAAFAALVFVVAASSVVYSIACIAALAVGAVDDAHQEEVRKI